jgi:hypothetical protein
MDDHRMMMMISIKSMTKKIPVSLFLFTFLIFCMPSLQAQQKDFQFWPSAGIDLGLNKNLKVMLEEEVRLKENCTQMERQVNDLGIGYKFNKYFRADLFYRIEANWKTYDDYRWKQGFYADFALKQTTGRFVLGYRLRLQSSRIEFNNNDDNLFSSFINRHKFTIAYNIQNIPITPFFEEEFFLNSASHQLEMIKNRTWLGITYSPGKMHEFSLKYGIDHDRLVADPLTSFIIAFNYTLNLKL